MAEHHPGARSLHPLWPRIQSSHEYPYFIDISNANIFRPEPSYEFLGCLFDCLPEEDF
jgi:hypothetical protein